MSRPALGLRRPVLDAAPPRPRFSAGRWAGRSRGDGTSLLLEPHAVLYFHIPLYVRVYYVFFYVLLILFILNVDLFHY